MSYRIPLYDVEPLTTYRLLAALGSFALLVAGLVYPTDAIEVAMARYAAIAALLLLMVTSFTSDRVRVHIGWAACLANVAVVAYLCSMLYVSQVAADSVIASFVGMLICGLVLHRVVLVVLFMITGASLHIVVAFAVADPIVNPIALTINVVLYTLFVGLLMCMQIIARERRQNTEAIMAAIFDQSSDALLYGDITTGETLQVNRRAEQLFDTQDAGLIGRLTREALQARGLPEIGASLARALDDPAWADAMEFHTASGRHFWGDVVLRRLHVPGWDLMMARITDISENRAREAALEAAKEAAEGAVVARGQFLANMSHEIRTPMNGVIGMTSLLLKTRLDAEQKRYVDMVRSSGESLLKIINEILDFSKIEAHQVQLEQQRFDLEEVALGALHVVAADASAKGLELLLRLQLDAHRFFIGDAQRLRQVLVNLLSNAVKFTAQGEVELSVQVVARQGQAAELHCQVLDTGIGLDPSSVDNLFQPFVQADASTTRKYGGTGLGLSISKSLVELMGGVIRVDSEPGHGAVFSFFVVVDRAPARASKGSEDLQGRCIGVVQQNARSGAVLAGLLRSVGLVADCYDSPEAALAAAPNGGWELLVADLDMSGMSGLAFTRQVRRLESRRTPAILLAPLESRETCDDEDVTVLRKPIRPSHLIQSVAYLLGGEDLAPIVEFRSDEARPDFGELSVLVAEDNPVNQQVVRQMLNKLGVRADIVGDGQEAVEAMERSAYDLVLMDLQMPRKDGLAATREIRAAWGRDAYVAAMTANALEGDRVACREAGMDDFIAKPVRLEDLEQRLRAALAHVRSRTLLAN